MMFPLAKFAFKAHAFGDLEGRDDAALNLLAGHFPAVSHVRRY